MTTKYLVKLALDLEPTWHQEPPLIKTGINGNTTEFYLRESATINFEFEAEQSCNLIVEFLNKQDKDTVPDLGLDKAVEIKAVSFFGIQDPRFAWAGVYEPCYPEPWATEQQKQGRVLEKQLMGHTYLSWNGKWTLTFDVPVFTWIHKVQNLGWIYT